MDQRQRYRTEISDVLTAEVIELKEGLLAYRVGYSTEPQNTSELLQHDIQPARPTDPTGGTAPINTARPETDRTPPPSPSPQSVHYSSSSERSPVLVLGAFPSPRPRSVPQSS